MACGIVLIGLMLSGATHAGILPTRDEAVEIFADIASEQAVSGHKLNCHKNLVKLFFAQYLKSSHVTQN